MGGGGGIYFELPSHERLKMKRAEVGFFRRLKGMQVSPIRRDVVLIDTSFFENAFHLSIFPSLHFFISHAALVTGLLLVSALQIELRSSLGPDILIHQHIQVNVNVVLFDDCDMTLTDTSIDSCSFE